MTRQNSTTSFEKQSFLSGGGEMGELMRSKDWNSTSLGPVEQWPQSLKTTLDIILHSRFPMFLWWGPALTCFYNDAYRPSLGQNGKHPYILGAPAQTAWAEIWDTIKPLIDRVLDHGESTWNEDQLIPIYRNGKMEDVYWSFCYSPVSNESGETAGVLVTCTETTDKILAYKKLEESKNQLLFAIEAAELGTWDYNPLTNKFTANTRLKNWFGLAPEKEIDLAYAINVITEKDRQRIMEAIQKALDYSSGGNYEAEYSIINPVTKREIVFRAKGKAWFNREKKPVRFNGTLEDVTQEVLARQTAVQSEQRFQAAIDAVGGIVWTNNAAGEMAGEQPGWAFLTGQSYDEYQGYGWSKAIHPDDAQPSIDAWNKALKERRTLVFEHRVKTQAGNYDHFSIRAVPLLNNDGSVREWVGVHTNITTQKKYEAALSESEKKFRDVANSAPVFIWMAYTDQQRYFFNTAWFHFTGSTLEQERGKGWIKGVHPEDMEKSFLLYDEAFSKQQEYQMEYRLRRHDGEYRWISARGVPRFSTGGAFEGFIGACMDIHEQVLVQKKLKENEERLNIIVSASGLGTWELNLNTMEVIYSGRHIEIFGYDKNTRLSHQEILEHLHPDDSPKRKIAFETAITSGTLYYESRIIAKDKSIRWIENKGKVFYDEQNLAYKIIGTTRDTTEEKNYEHQLVEREQKFRLLADSMPQLVWTGDAEGKVDYFSRAVCDYSGLTPDLLKKGGWMQLVHPDDREENIKAWTQAISSGKDYIFEHRLKRYDGEYRWQLSRAIPQRDANGKIQMWVGTSTDIQDMKEHDQQKDFFISMASHELKTPVTSIKGYVQILQGAYQKSEDAFLKRSLRIIDKQIATLTNLISDLLDVSKIKSGSLVLNRENFCITSLTQEAITEITHINPDFSIHFSRQSNVTIYADKGRIGQVLINFLTNAVKYSPQSKEITVESYAEDNQVITSVKDSGIGISKANQEKIFERFYRVEGKNEKTFPGFGIGLFIAAEIIKRHHGKIWVESEPDKGSVFYFSLPIR